MATITLLTASLPERFKLLGEAIDSVHAQSRRPDNYAIGIDYRRATAPVVYNRLAIGVSTEWLTFLDDDDLLDPNHLEVLEAHMTPDVDVVYTGCRSVGGYNFEAYNGPFDSEMLQHRSIVPITAAIRTKVFNAIGHFPRNPSYDWDLWRNAGRAGARFRHVNEITWTYRFHGGNQSQIGLEACH